MVKRVESPLQVGVVVFFFVEPLLKYVHVLRRVHAITCNTTLSTATPLVHLFMIIIVA